MALTRFPALAALSVGLIMCTGSARAAATDWVGDSRAAVRLITATGIISLPIQPSKLAWNSGLPKGGTVIGEPRETRASHQRLTGPLQKISLALKFPGLLHIVSSSRNCRTASTRTTWFFRSNYI